jgi:hypothetical protein
VWSTKVRVRTGGWAGVVVAGVVVAGVVVAGVVVAGVVMAGVVMAGVLIAGVVMTGVVMTGVVMAGVVAGAVGMGVGAEAVVVDEVVSTEMRVEIEDWVGDAGTAVVRYRKVVGLLISRYNTGARDTDGMGSWSRLKCSWGCLWSSSAESSKGYFPTTLPDRVFTSIKNLQFWLVMGGVRNNWNESLPIRSVLFLIATIISKDHEIPLGERRRTITIKGVIT